MNSKAGMKGMCKTDRGESSMSSMPGCRPNALPK